jgi:hypothetical protein
MGTSLPQSVFNRVIEENRYFLAAPAAFYSAWKRGVEIAGIRYFGDGSDRCLERATSMWDLRPNMIAVGDAFGVLSSGERLFLSVLVSFYNSREGGAMLRRCQFEGLADLGGLDLPRRTVIAELLINYGDW